MRKWICVPMMTLCLLLAGCGTGTQDAEALRLAYQQMSGCTMTAEVTCLGENTQWEGTLQCDYVPEGKSTVEVLKPEIIAGVRAVLSGEELTLCYEDLCLNAGTVSAEQLSPMACLPRLMEALREGWLLEENRETWGETECLRILVDQTGKQGKIFSALWLRTSDGLPLRGEIAVDEEIILTAEFTEFAFYDKINT